MKDERYGGAVVRRSDQGSSQVFMGGPGVYVNGRKISSAVVHDPYV